MYDPSYDPFWSPPPGEPATILIDGVEAGERMTAPQDAFHMIEVRIPSRNVTVTIASPNRAEAVQLSSELYIAAR